MTELLLDPSMVGVGAAVTALVASVAVAVIVLRAILLRRDPGIRGR